MQAAIFDLDGTLLDSMGVWRDVDERFFAKRGITVPEDYQRIITTMRMYDSAVYTIETFGFDMTPEALLQEWLDMARYEYAHNIQLKPYARQYLELLKSRGIKLGTASSLVPELCTPALKNLGVYDLFDAFTSSLEVPYGKEHPAIYRMAAQRLGVDAEQCVFYDDMPLAICGAKCAGMTAVGVYDSNALVSQDVLRAAADRFIMDFSEEIDIFINTK